MKPAQTKCPACSSTCELRASTRDRVVYVCPECGGFGLSKTALTFLENNPRKLDVEAFRKLVRTKTHEGDYPLITAYDLDALL